MNINLDVKRFLVCSTGEEVEFPLPEDSLEAAKTLCGIMQAEEKNSETWHIVAELSE